MSVSKGGHAHPLRCPSFETPCLARLLRMGWVGQRKTDGRYAFFSASGLRTLIGAPSSQASMSLIVPS